MFADNLIGMLEGVHLGGAIKECVIIIKDGQAIIQAMDMTSTVFVRASTDFDYEDNMWGITNIPLLIKYFRHYEGKELEITQDDNRLIIRSGKGSVVKYLLAEADLIPTFDAEWEKSPPLDALEYKDSFNIPIGQLVKLQNLMTILTPAMVQINVSDKGILVIQAGPETDHQVLVTFGRTKLQPCAVKIYGKHLLSILKQAKDHEKITLFVDSENSAMIKADNTEWLIEQIQGDEIPEELSNYEGEE